MDLELPNTYFDNRLDAAARNGNPLQFYLMESNIIDFYERRIPDFGLKVMVSKRHFDRWNRRRSTLQQIEDSIERAHVQLVQVVLSGFIYSAAYEAGYYQRELQWTEEARRQTRTENRRYDIQKVLWEESEKAAKMRDDRHQGYATELLDIRQQHEINMMKAAVPSIEQRLDDITLYNDRIRAILNDINNGPGDQRVKNQQATQMITLAQMIFQ